MPQAPVIAVYGVPGSSGVPGVEPAGPLIIGKTVGEPAGEPTGAPVDGPRFVRLGSGRLAADVIVILDPDLSEALENDDPPPRPRFVGIASRLDGKPFVEVVEVVQAVRSSQSNEWAAELATPAESPVDPDAGFGIPEGGGPANGFCFFFPSLSFC